MEMVFAKNEMVVKNAAVGNMLNRFSFKNMKKVELITSKAMTAMIPIIHIFIVIMFFTQWIAILFLI